MPRTTSDIIDQAIRDNSRWELLIFGIAGIFIAVGATLIVWAMIHKEAVGAFAGVAESVLFVPALNAAMKTRRANIMLRMLEIPLGKSSTAAEAAEMLQRVFESHFLETPSSPREIAKAEAQ